MVRCSAESDVLWSLPAAVRCWLVNRGPWEGAVFRVGLGAAVMIASASPCFVGRCRRVATSGRLWTLGSAWRAAPGVDGVDGVVAGAPSGLGGPGTVSMG